MPFVSSGSATPPASITRPIVKGLFLASCLLSVVSFYTTQQGMALYLSGWFSILAALGIQTALVFVAWLIGFTRERRALLVGVYAITAAISIAFSYVSLYTWFSSRERPAEIQRKLYDTLNAAAGQSQQILERAIAEGQNHVLALEEMTTAEKEHGYISRAQDADPYLAQIRAAVAGEARTYSGEYREGAGQGLRYTAFERYASLARQSLDRMRQAQAALADLPGRMKPSDSSEKQLTQFRQIYDSLPWSDIEQALHSTRLEHPAVPNYADFVDRTASNQEDLMLAFQELFTAPTARHVFALGLGAFIDIVVFLLAFASGPYFFGSSEQQWIAGGAALEALDDQVFVRDFLRKLDSGARGTARVEAAALSPGEQQVCLLLAARGLAVTAEEAGRLYYLLSPEIHQQLLESLASQGFRLKASAPSPA